jgi:hypothetical protein
MTPSDCRRRQAAECGPWPDLAAGSTPATTYAPGDEISQSGTTQMVLLASDYEVRRLQMAVTMIKEEVELARVRLTEAHRLRQEINRLAIAR